jgi:hypothetical protein
MLGGTKEILPPPKAPGTTPLRSIRPRLSLATMAHREAWLTEPRTGENALRDECRCLL